MPDSEPSDALLQEWVTKAENDLTAAAHMLKLGGQGPTEAMAFHAQQCVEKYLKALLAALGQEIPKIHDIEVLFMILPPFDPPLLAPKHQAALTRYATRTRYPGSGEVSYSEARAAVALARRVRADVRRKLPKAALRRPKP